MLENTRDTSPAEPLITVIIPSYNRETTIARAIDSVLRQTYQNIELLVVDDGSTDSTVDIVSAYSDPRLRLIVLEKNGGASVARNRGIDEAKGEFIAFQDSDDEWLLGKLAKQVEFASSYPDVGFFCCGLLRHAPLEERVDQVPASMALAATDADYSQLLSKNYAWTQTWLVRRQVFTSGLAFDTRIKRIQDWDLAITMAGRFGLKFQPQVLVVAHETAGSLLSLDLQHGEDLKKMLVNNQDLFGGCAAAHARHCRSISRREAMRGNASGYRYWAWRALRLQPLVPSYWLFGGLALLGAGLTAKLIALGKDKSAAA